mgnify:CR=1 FL=1
MAAVIAPVVLRRLAVIIILSLIGIRAGIWIPVLSVLVLVRISLIARLRIGAGVLASRVGLTAVLRALASRIVLAAVLGALSFLRLLAPV